MRIQALIFFISAVTAQQGAGSEAVLSGHSSPDVSSSRLRRIPTVGLEQRDADEAEDATLCFFLKEKDTESQVSCKHRLNLRSKFNYNPFGLRFGKRGGRGRSAGERRRRGELLPALLLLTQLEQAS